MFQKPAFGASTSGFGMQSTFGAPAANTTSPFGGFKPAASTSAFGAPPAFGANTNTQPAAGGGLFGATNTTGGLFGASTTATPAPAFGAANTSFGFGANTSANTGLFANNTSTGLFGNNQQNNAFGAKPAGFGFGATTTSTNQNTGLFGNTAATGTGLFGGQTNTLSGGGLFSNTAGGFGAAQTATGTAHAKYNPLVGTDVVVKSGTSQSVNIKHHCITCMKEYEGKSLEELRLEDYQAGRKGSRGGMFPFQQPQQENKPLFGGTPGGFGQTATTSAPSVFGGGSLTGGTSFGQTSTFSFGNNAQANTNTTGLFGANKPLFGATPAPSTGLFGAPASTQATGFGTNTATFGFGSNMQNQNTTGGLFGAKPATSVFGASSASSGFGGFGAGGSLFAAKPTQTQAPTLTQPGLGTQTLSFGANTSTAGGLFGNNAFGKPATTQPTFGFGSAQPTLGVGLGNTFQNKPAAPGFGQLGGSTMFQAPNANNSFRTGLDSGLGGGMFGGNTGLGGTSLGFGMNANNSAIANLSGVSAAGNVHEQILTLAARPYGDSPLFKDLLPDSSTTAEDVLKPTNPAAMKAVLERSQYRVTSPSTGRLTLLPRTATTDKKSLFDGLEESDASLEDKLSLKPSRKRLVLRVSQRNSHENNDSGAHYTSQEDVQSRDLNGSAPPGKENSLDLEHADRAKRNISFPDNNNLESSDRQGSWLSSKLPWGDKENPNDNEPTPRIYPSLEKELPNDGSERRSSWLTTKTLRKPPPASESAENSVRELGLRPTASSVAVTSQDHGNSDIISANEEIPASPREMPPHPTGVKLTRPGYYTIPTLDEIIPFIDADGSCVIPHFTIGRTNYGNVYYDSEINVAGLDLDSLVHFMNKEVIVYPDDSVKPPVGEGLNRRAIVTLDRVWPRDKTENRPITDPERLWEFECKLRRVCEKHETHFLEYRPQTGSWVFRVDHFSKYGWTESDDEEELTPEVLKRQIANQALQKSGAPATGPPKPLNAAVSGPGLSGPGLGGLGLGVPTQSDSIFAMQQASFNLLNGASRAFEMDTTEDNTESQSLYQDNRSFGVKSPTSELARLEHRQSHHVQLMKASLYADMEMEDDVSISTGDQLVPMSAPLLSVAESTSTQPLLERKEDVQDESMPLATQEAQMRPLIVRPHTIVLKYHRKIPPFKNTIAGHMDAACIADMAISRARHSRVGFGTNGTLAFVTAYDALDSLNKDADLSRLNLYLRGRGENDWSEPIVARMAIQQTDKHYNIQEILSRQLETLFKHSEFVEANEHSPRLVLRDSPSERYAALHGLLQDAKAYRNHTARFGVSGAYCYEVWKLCEALWGLDLENDGVPGMDDQSIVNRHKKFLQWMKEAVAKITDEELAKARKGETEDEEDGHSCRIWTLLLGGRILDACKLAKENGDLNMAALIAQAAGDESFRSLIQRQLSVWRSCGADTLISVHKRGILNMLCGLAPSHLLATEHWMQALHVTARYLCPQVPTLENILRRYESLFTNESEENTDLDLTTLEDDALGMQYPLPDYTKECDVVITHSTKKRRILDLQYELIRTRAFNTQPKLRPASYTRDPLDYSLCFTVSAWLGVLSSDHIVGIAQQLEASGAWHLAIQCLCYHSNDVARGHLIRSILSRHAPAKVETPEMKSRLDLLHKLRIPEKWVLLAQAHRAKYEHLPALEAEYLVGAEQWNAAHKVLLDELLPEAVLSDNLQSIAPLLEKMNKAAERHELSGWANGGQALHHYLHVCDEIRGLVSTHDRSVVQSRLQALRPTVAAACKALHHMKHKSPRHSAARAEMGARLVQLSVAGGEPPQHLSSLLRTLKLPPDCTTTALHKITTDLAEQASELCIESVNSSPISSHHRATAAS